MDKIKRLILLSVPMSICNFRCNYCYLSQKSGSYQNKQPDYKYSPEHVGKALSPERLGGLAFFNVGAAGETLLTKDIDLYVYELLKQGHYVEFVTNLTVTPVLEKMLSWDKELLKRLEFKCSFHYLELKKKNYLERYASNVHKIWDAGCSANIEITPCDEMIPYINEIKSFSLDYFGALPHLSIARNDDSTGIEYLTHLSMEEYDSTWSQFQSEFWEFKKSIFRKKRSEFCYAGDWLLNINLATGMTSQCYRGRFTQNVFENLSTPIVFKAIGHCLQPHCYNGHALLTLGCIPHFTTVKYGDIRNRIKSNGEEWLQPELKSFFNSTLVESNKEYSETQKQRLNAINFFLDIPFMLKQQIKKIIKK